MKKLLLLFLLKKALIASLIFFPFFAYAAPAFSPKMGQAIGGVMERKAIQRGFASNDPRFNSALVATGAVLTAAATGVVAVSGAPLWVTVGLGALAAGAVSLALDAAVNWYFNGDGTVTYTDNVGGVGNYGQLVKGGDFWSTCSTGSSCYYMGATPAGVAQANWIDLTWGSGKYQNWGPAWSTCEIVDATHANCWDSGNKNGSLQYLYKHSNSPYGCDSGLGTIGGVCKSLIPPNSPPAGQQTKLPELAAAALTPQQRDLPVNPKIIADITNKVWKDAASQPNYQGLPYSYSDPVTAADVEAWRASNPSSYPTVGDAVSSPINPSTGTVPVTTPGQVTNPTPGIPTAPGGSPQLDLGTDPGIGAPNLEATPTGSQILAPITGLMPDLRNFQVPSHQAECPKPEFDIAILHTRVRMDAHCTLFEGVRGPLYNGSLVAWLIAALLIVLSA